MNNNHIQALYIQHKNSPLLPQNPWCLKIVPHLPGGGLVGAQFSFLKWEIAPNNILPTAPLTRVASPYD